MRNRMVAVVGAQSVVMTDTVRGGDRLVYQCGTWDVYIRRETKRPVQWGVVDHAVTVALQHEGVRVRYLRRVTEEKPKKLSKRLRAAHEHTERLLW